MCGDCRERTLVLFLDQVADEGFDFLEGLSRVADVERPDEAVATDDDHGRDTSDPIVGEGVVFGEDDGPVKLILLEEAGHRRVFLAWIEVLLGVVVSVVAGDAENFEALVFVLFVQFVDVWEGRFAGSAPVGHEVDDDDFAFEGFDGGEVTVLVGDGDFRRCGSDHSGADSGELEAASRSFGDARIFETGFEGGKALVALTVVDQNFTLGFIDAADSGSQARLEFVVGDRIGEFGEDAVEEFFSRIEALFIGHGLGEVGGRIGGQGHSRSFVRRDDGVDGRDTFGGVAELVVCREAVEFGTKPLSRGRIGHHELLAQDFDVFVFLGGCIELHPAQALCGFNLCWVDAFDGVLGHLAHVGDDGVVVDGFLFLLSGLDLLSLVSPNIFEDLVRVGGADGCQEDGGGESDKRHLISNLTQNPQFLTETEGFSRIFVRN